MTVERNSTIKRRFARAELLQWGSFKLMRGLRYYGWNGVVPAVEHSKRQLAVLDQSAAHPGFWFISVVHLPADHQYSEDPFHADVVDLALREVFYFGLDTSRWGAEPHKAEYRAALVPRIESYEAGVTGVSRANEPGDVYFIQPESGGLIKVGFSTHVESRFQSLQLTSPVRLRLLATLTGTRATESELHRQFASLRCHGEWFHPSQELVAFIAGVAGGVK